MPAQSSLDLAVAIYGFGEFSLLIVRRSKRAIDPSEGIDQPDEFDRPILTQ